MDFNNICEVCLSKELSLVLDLGLHPLCDDLIEVGTDRMSIEYPIKIVLCQNCLTAHQQVQVPKHNLFPKTYHYRSRFTSDVVSGMKDLTRRVEKIKNGLNGKIVLDIGSNDGTLLDLFKMLGAKTIGVEPTDAAKESLSKGHTIYQDFFEKGLAEEIYSRHGYPDVITFTNVFAHIENLPLLLESIRVVMGENTLLVIENHYLGSVLSGMQFDTFYHEHPRTYSAQSFLFIASSLDAKIHDIEFPKRYGGNIRVFITKSESVIDPDKFNDISTRESKFLQLFLEMNTYIEHWIVRTKELFSTLNRSYGPLPAKAFPGRAAILIKLLGLTPKEIYAVYEKNGSMKIGHYLPGTKIPILPDTELQNLEPPTPIINLAWHIPEEISLYLADLGFQGKIYNIIEK
jgi:hypothetical protein